MALNICKSNLGEYYSMRYPAKGVSVITSEQAIRKHRLDAKS